MENLQGFTDIQKEAYLSVKKEIMDATEEELDEMIKEDNPDFVADTIEEKQKFELELQYAYIAQASDNDCQIVYLY